MIWHAQYVSHSPNKCKYLQPVDTLSVENVSSNFMIVIQLQKLSVLSVGMTWVYCSDAFIKNDLHNKALKYRQK